MIFKNIFNFIIFIEGINFFTGLALFLCQAITKGRVNVTRKNNVMISHVCMVGFAILISGSFPIGTVVAGSIDPVTLTFFRFLIASFIMWIFLIFTGRMQRFYFKKPMRFILLGACFSFYFVFMFEALKTASPVVTSGIFTLMPFLALCLDFLIFGKRASLRLLVYLIIGAIGTLTLVFKGTFENLMLLKLDYGELVFFFGTLIHAIYALLLPKLRNQEPLSVVTFAVMSGAAAVLLVFFPFRILQTDWSKIPIEVYFSVGYLSIFASIFSLILLTKASETLSSSHFTAYTFSTPFWVALLDYCFLDMKLESYVCVGGVFIFLSLLLLFLHADRFVGGGKACTCNQD